jgi:5-methylcytosine-specific restriction endonuclease McrA
MSMSNTSDWHIDHIVPLSRIPYVDEDDPLFRRAWALSNLAPLWKEDNISKGNRLDFVLPDRYINARLRAAYENADWSMLGDR